MKLSIRIMLAASVVIFGVLEAMAVEEPSYKVLKKDNNFEIRDYASHILAETVVEGDLEQAGKKAFRRLFRYISGENRTRTKVAMTAPVSQKPKGEKIEMTAPVVTMNTEKGMFMAFVMPERFDMQSIPTPSSSMVKMQLVEPRKLAAIRFSGYMSQGSYDRNLGLLRDALEGRGISTVGEPLLMQYNDPWTPPFSRRNEIALQVIDGNLAGA